MVIMLYLTAYDYVVWYMDKTYVYIAHIGRRKSTTHSFAAVRITINSMSFLSCVVRC